MPPNSGRSAAPRLAHVLASKGRALCGKRGSAHRLLLLTPDVFSSAVVGRCPECLAASRKAAA